MAKRRFDLEGASLMVMVKNGEADRGIQLDKDEVCRRGLSPPINSMGRGKRSQSVGGSRHSVPGRNWKASATADAHCRRTKEDEEADWEKREVWVSAKWRYDWCGECSFIAHSPQLRGCKKEEAQ